MNSISECHCGCKALIGPADPSPDFKWPQCQKLWLASLDKPDPDRWRFEQRILSLLFRVSWDWRQVEWDFEWTDAHIAMHDPGGDPAQGLAALYSQHEQLTEWTGEAHILPVLTRPSLASV